MLFLKKFILGFGALALILIGGSGTQSSSLILQGGGFIGLIIGLITLYIFTKMAWRAMGCLPSFLVVVGIIAFILYAIGGFNNGIAGIGDSLKVFLGQQPSMTMGQGNTQPMSNGAMLMDDDTDYGAAIDENFSSGIGEAYESQAPIQQPQVQPQMPQQQPQPQAQNGNTLQNLINSFTGNAQNANAQAGINPQMLPVLYSPAKVINGDTLQIQGRYFKLYGIDAPESSQTCADRTGRSYNCGRQAALWLRGWLGDNTLECRIMQQDAKGNMVGTCSLGQYDLGAALVNAGWAVAYAKYTDIYLPYEEQARINGRGLWQGKFYKPWDWRALQAQKPKIKVIKPKRRSDNIFGL